MYGRLSWCTVIEEFGRILTYVVIYDRPIAINLFGRRLQRNVDVFLFRFSIS